MKILILDSSSRSASAAICEDGRLLGEYYTNNGKVRQIESGSDGFTVNYMYASLIEPKLW